MDVLLAVQRAQRLVEQLVIATPSGPVRNKLTEANIHLMAAEQAMIEANYL